MTKRVRNYILSGIGLILILGFVFMMWLSHQWANGMNEIGKELARIKTDLDDDTPTYRDTIYENIRTTIDTTIRE